MKNRRKSAGIAATLIIAAILIAYWVAVFLLVTFTTGERWLMLLAGIICLPLSIALIVTAVRRIKEINEEDEDDYRKY